MKHIHIAVFDPQPPLTVLKEEIYISLAQWLREMGYSVSLDRGVLNSSSFNILVGFPYISQEIITQLVSSAHGYAIFDVEVIDEGMVNYKPDTRQFFEEPFVHLFHNAKAFFTYYQQSAQFIRTQFDLPTYIIKPSYCQMLKTHSALEPALRDIDVLFFGRVYGEREKHLSEVSKICNMRILDVADLTTFYFRNELAIRSKIVLHLRHREPFRHIGMMRLLSMAHIRAFSLSEDNDCVEESVRPLSAWWNPEESSLVDAIAYWLTHSEEREKQALQASMHIADTRLSRDFAAFVERYCAI